MLIYDLSIEVKTRVNIAEKLSIKIYGIDVHKRIFQFAREE